MKNILFVILILPIILTACSDEKIVYINDINITPHVVLNGIVYAGKDTSFFYITKSRPIYNNDTIWNGGNMNISDYEIIDNADFKLLVNQKPYSVEYSKADSAYIFTDKMDERDSVGIEITHNGEKIKSRSVLPAPPQILSVDTVSVKRIEYGYPRDYIKFEIKIKDNQGIDDYYRLIINSAVYNLDNNQIYHSYNSLDYFSNDPVLLNGYTGSNNDSDIIIPSSRYNSFSIFRDIMFVDKEYTLTLYVSNERSYYTSNDGCRLGKRMSIKLQSISEDLYKYYASLQYNRQSSSQAIKVYTNVEGGLGILGVCNEIEIYKNQYQY